MARQTGSGNRWWTPAVVLVLLVCAVGAGWWAARVTVSSPEVAEPGAGAVVEPVWGEVSSGSVGRSLPLSVTLRQPAVPVAVNGLSGVVTSVEGGEASQGEVVFVVGATPVRVVQAQSPFWRDLVLDVEGEDVVALQDLLVGEGHLAGEADGAFGAATETAVKVWQREQGLPQTGQVVLGELVAVPQLPVTVTLGESIQVGAQVAGGEEAVLAPTGEREFALVVTPEQAQLIPAETTVEVTFQDHTWEAVIAGSSVDEMGSTEFELSGTGGGPVCADECSALPGDEQVTLRSEVVIVPRVEGATVPAAAVRSHSDGSAYVVTREGEVQVSVVGSGQGVAVVEGAGIEPGVEVQLTGDAAGALQAPEPEPGDGADPTQGG